MTTPTLKPDNEGVYRLEIEKVEAPRVSHFWPLGVGASLIGFGSGFLGYDFWMALSGSACFWLLYNVIQYGRGRL